ncbi:hypothetical protein C0J52_26868 [Blattella germanica]|nr:hypothetical protein C0J52_26868 [Blattella germanica]
MYLKIINLNILQGTAGSPGQAVPPTVASFRVPQYMVLVSAIDWLLGDIGHCTSHSKLKQTADSLETEPGPRSQLCAWGSCTSLQIMHKYAMYEAHSDEAEDLSQLLLHPLIGHHNLSALLTAVVPYLMRLLALKDWISANSNSSYVLRLKWDSPEKVADPLQRMMQLECCLKEKRIHDKPYQIFHLLHYPACSLRCHDDSLHCLADCLQDFQFHCPFYLPDWNAGCLEKLQYWAQV